MKSNFTQALRELTGFDEHDPSAPNEKKSTLTDYADALQEEINVELDTSSADPAYYNKETTQNFSDTDYSHISGSMVIDGEISSHDNIKIEGQVYGNVLTSANISASNLIIGDLKASNIILDCARVKGDVSLEGNLSIGESSVISGNILCGTLVVAGKVKGNMDVRESAVVKDSALIIGDIIADTMSADSGSIINGSINIRTNDLIDINSEFDFGGEFQ